jgi:hypothetical protein
LLGRVCPSLTAVRCRSSSTLPSTRVATVTPMASPSGTGGRKRGSIRRLGNLLQVRVSAGKDPATGERLVLVDSVTIEKPGSERSERAAQKERREGPHAAPGRG